MSPLPIDLELVLAPDRICGCCRRGFPWRRHEDRVAIDVAPATGPSDWAAPLDALSGWLAQAGFARGRARVVLADCWARFALIPWTDEIQGREEEQALALARFESQFQDMNGWVIKVAPATYGATRVACALEHGLLDGLETVFRSHRIRCDSLMPRFTATWNQVCASIASPEAMLVVLDTGSLVMATTRAGQWHSIRNVRCEPSWPALQTWVERESLLQGFAIRPPVYCEAADLATEFKHPSLADWQWLPSVQAVGQSASTSVATGGG